MASPDRLQVTTRLTRKSDPAVLLFVEMAHAPEERPIDDWDVRVETIDGPVGAYTNVTFSDGFVCTDADEMGELVKVLAEAHALMAQADKERGLASLPFLRSPMRVLETGTVVPLHRPAA